MVERVEWRAGVRKVSEGEEMGEGEYVCLWEEGGDVVRQG